MMTKRSEEWEMHFSLHEETSMDAMDNYFLDNSDDDSWKNLSAKMLAEFFSEDGDYLDTSDSPISSEGSSTFDLDNIFTEIRNHDCMWTGFCLSKEHSRTYSPSPFVPVFPQLKPVQSNVNSVLINNQKPAPAPKSVLPTLPKPSPVKSVVSQTSDKKKGDILCNILTNNKRTGVIVQKTVGRSLLLSSRTTQNVASTPAPVVKQEPPAIKQDLPVIVKPELPIVLKTEHPTVPHRQNIESNDFLSRPLTPQSLSDDDLHSDHNDSVFRNALDVMLSQTAERDDWDEELLLNFGSSRTLKTESVAPEAEVNRLNTITHFDHNYDVTNKQPIIKTEGLGVQTPSDSEEEIDVVTLTERSIHSSRSSSISSNTGFSLPNNPSIEDQEELQELTTSKLLSASKAVSRKLKSASKKPGQTGKKSSKRQRLPSESFDEDDLDDYDPSFCQPAKKARTGKKGRSKFSDSEPDSKERRSLHNNMERMRRIDLRNSFEELRVMVPSLTQKERAAKVVILKEAAAYCCDLGTQSRLMSMQVAALRREQFRLRGIVSGLRKAAAVVVQKGKRV